MSENKRRDFLKLFGAGALIAPVIDGTAIARIIEPPKVEIWEPETAVVKRPLDLRHLTSMELKVTYSDGVVDTFTVDNPSSRAYVHAESPTPYEFRDVTTHGSTFREYAPFSLGADLEVDVRFANVSRNTSPEFRASLGWARGIARRNG